MISRLSLGRPLDYLGVLLAKKCPLCKELSIYNISSIEEQETDAYN